MAEEDGAIKYYAPASLDFSVTPSMKFDFDAVTENDSPFPEVRASVSNIDDPEIPVMTFRMWVIGLVFCMISGLVHSIPLLAVS